MLRFFLGLVSGALLVDVLRRSGLLHKLGDPNPSEKDLRLTFVRDGEVWRVAEEGGSLPGKGHQVGRNGRVRWELREEGPQYVVLQLDPEYFEPSAGTKCSADGFVILAKGATNFAEFKVRGKALPVPPVSVAGKPRPLEYVYAVWCMNGGGTVRQIEKALTEGGTEGLIKNEDLAPAVGGSPPRMIFI